MSILLFQFEITMHNLQNLVKNAYVHVFITSLVLNLILHGKIFYT